MDWPPLGRIAASGLIQQAAALLATPDFQAASCSLLRQLLQRKQGHVRQTLNDYIGHIACSTLTPLTCLLSAQ